MKKTFIILSICFAAVLAAVLPRLSGAASVSAEAADLNLTPQYARVISDYAMLYRTGSGSVEHENRYFILPKGYFVFLENAADGISDAEYYKVTYDTFSGFVKASDVDIVSFTPLLKYASGQKLRVETPDGGYVHLREFPTKAAQSLVEGGLPDETADVRFYNYVTVGEDKWYFVEYGGKQGYIFGDYAVITQEIAVNDGAAEPVPEPPPPKSVDDPTAPKPLDVKTLAILIAVIGIPAVIILVLLFKPRRRRPRYRQASYDTNRVPRYLDEE